MKKSVLIILIVLSFSCSIEAQEIGNNKLEVNGGLTYNNYIYKKYDINNGITEVDDDYLIREDLHQGTGYYFEAIYWLDHQWGLGVGLQNNEMEAEWESGTPAESYEYKVDLNTYYSSLIYRLNRTVQVYIDFNYNQYQEHYAKEDFSTDIKAGQGLGLMVGTKINYALNSSFALILNTGYYLSNIEIDERYSSYQGEVINVDDEELKISGLGLKIGMQYKF